MDKNNRDTPIDVITISYKTLPHRFFGFCPNCKNPDIQENENYCFECGQALSWDRFKEKIEEESSYCT